jgi:hypothetical protein
MKLVYQVCTLEQAQKLKDLGILQTSLASWFNDTFEPMFNIANKEEKDWRIFNDIHPVAAAFTVSELGCMLNRAANDIFFHNPTQLWTQKKSLIPNMFKTQAEAYANWLLHMLEIDFITVEKANDRLKTCTL